MILEGISLTLNETSWLERESGRSKQDGQRKQYFLGLQTLSANTVLATLIFIPSCHLDWIEKLMEI